MNHITFIKLSIKRHDILAAWSSEELFQARLAENYD